MKEHNLNCPQIPDHTYRIIIGCSGSGKTNAILNLACQQPGIDKIYLHAKDLYEAKHVLLIKKCYGSGLKHFNESKPTFEYSNDMNDIYEHIEEYNPFKKHKVLIALDDMIFGMLTTKKLFQ